MQVIRRSRMQFPPEAYLIKNKMSNKIEKQYNELRKKHKLPDFKEIDFEFEISDLDETNFLIRAIIRRIAEKLDFHTTMLEEVLQPDTSNLYAMHETGFFDEGEKKQMYDLYRNMMNFNRQSVEILLENNEKDQADFINNFLKEWREIKNELLGFIKKMRSSWKTDVDIEEDVGYLG